MTEAIETWTVSGLKVELHYDNDASSPRENDNLGTMACWHRHYNLGDVQPSESPAEYLAEEKPVLQLPLYLYDHSGLRMSTGDFGDPWDSGQVGVIFVTRERLLKEYSTKRLTKRVLKQAEEVLKAEVAEYDSYLSGDVYGYTVTDADGDVLDSCWGFIGHKWAKEAATEAAEYEAKQAMAMESSLDAH